MKESTRNILALLALGGVAIFATRKKEDPDPSDGGGEGPGDSGQGCTDPDALNYDPAALIDDGSCDYPVLGCTDASAFNFNPSATEDDGSCVPVEYGCLDPNACNYDSLANTSAPDLCEYASTLYPDGDKDCFGNCYFDSDEDGICDMNEVVGCTDPTADENYNSEATDTDNSQCVYYGCTDPAANNTNPKATPGNPYAESDCRYDGCTAEGADNYDPTADDDDGSCIFSGCTNGGNPDEGVPPADNYDSNATQDDGSCVWSGCMDMEASNFEAWATIDDGSCIILGCTDENADEGNNLGSATQDDGSCGYRGCTNPAADNYDDTATLDNGSCIISGCTDSAADNYNQEANNDDGSCVISGCTDSTASNYVPNANVDDGSCTILGCTDPESPDFNSAANVDDGSCTYPTEIEGCTTQGAINYNPQATIDDDSCQIKGCMDEDALNWNPDANVDGVCEYAGCMNPEADNYNPQAVQDDPENPCIISGCMTSSASNYNASANVDDGSCEFNTDVPTQFIWGQTDGVGNHPIFGYALQSIGEVPFPCYGTDGGLDVVLGTSAQLAAATDEPAAINAFINDHYGQTLGAAYLNNWWAGICATSGFGYKPLYDEVAGMPSQEYELFGECVPEEPLIFGSSGEANQFWADYTGGQDAICNSTASFFPSYVAQQFVPGLTTPFYLAVFAQVFFQLPGVVFDEFGNILIPWQDVSPTICAEPDSGIENV